MPPPDEPQCPNAQPNVSFYSQNLVVPLPGTFSILVIAYFYMYVPPHLYNKYNFGADAPKL